MHLQPPGPNCTHSSLTHPLTHSLTHARTHALTHSLARSRARSLAHPPTHPTHTYTPPFDGSWVLSSILCYQATFAAYKSAISNCHTEACTASWSVVCLVSHVAFALMQSFTPSSQTAQHPVVNRIGAECNAFSVLGPTGHPDTSAVKPYKASTGVLPLKCTGLYPPHHHLQPYPVWHRTCAGGSEHSHPLQPVSHTQVPSPQRRVHLLRACLSA
jgi:hypothetical protein